MISLFKKKELPQEKIFLEVDIHSHLLPGIDDGCKNIEESLTAIKILKNKGYKKIITTPHIISGFYENTPEIINEKLKELSTALVENNIDIKVEAAAEYYLDEQFVSSIEKGSELLTFGNNYLLFELGFYNEPIQFSATIFALQSNGYKPVIAHPERYLYMYNQYEKVKDWVDKGILLQINLCSLIGYYSASAQHFCEKLIDDGLVSFVGTDAHNPKQLELLPSIYASKYFLKLAEKNLLNNSLL